MAVCLFVSLLQIILENKSLVFSDVCIQILWGRSSLPDSRRQGKIRKRKCIQNYSQMKLKKMRMCIYVSVCVCVCLYVCEEGGGNSGFC